MSWKCLLLRRVSEPTCLPQMRELLTRKSFRAPMEYAVEMFGKLGLRYLCVVEEGTGKLVGVILKKRLVVWLEGLKH